MLNRSAKVERRTALGHGLPARDGDRVRADKGVARGRGVDDGDFAGGHQEAWLRVLLAVVGLVVYALCGKPWLGFLLTKSLPFSFLLLSEKLQ